MINCLPLLLMQIALFVLLTSAFPASCSTSAVTTTLKKTDLIAHPHNGRLAPFPPIPPFGSTLNNDQKNNYKSTNSHNNDNTDLALMLSHADEQALARGKSVKTSWDGRTMLVQDIKAPAHVVYNTIKDYNSYAGRAPSTLKSDVYSHEYHHIHNDQQDTVIEASSSTPLLEIIKARLTTGGKGYKMTFYTKAICNAATRTIVWTLDYMQKSDMDDNVGYWHIQPHPDKPNQHCRIFYSTMTLLHPKFPSFVTNYINKHSLTDGPKWVKEYSEKAYKEAPNSDVPSHANPILLQTA